ncbi:MAG: ABC transporter ATP-binding protein, partial [Lachnospiraceae bacterium]|nr:ABC transporter ATP-binding protein [Lachnospiraceae bacterium]
EGKLVEELSHEELLAKTHTRLALKTGDAAKTATILEEELKIHDYKITYDNEILIYEGLDDLERISKTVTDHGMIITRFNLEGESLEEYYIGKVGEHHE